MARPKSTAAAKTAAKTTAKSTAKPRKRGPKPKATSKRALKAPNTAPGDNIEVPEMPADCRHVNRTPEERHSLIVRLNRLEGQVRGIRRMVENDVYCPDVLVQVAAASAALDAFTREMLDLHIRNCVKQDLIDGKDETVDELLHTLHKLVR